MNRTYVKKALAVAVILLFIGMSVVPSTADKDIKDKPFQINFDGNTLYVGGSGPNNYTTIQDAINDSVDGDTVFVYDDSSPYYENIVIDKSIDLIGENKNTTVIDADDSGGHVIILNANQVNLTGFTIQNHGGIPNAAGIFVSSNNNNISGNNILYIPHYGQEGIWLYHSSENIISENTINHHHYGIWLEDSYNNYISRNYIDDIWHWAIILGNSPNNIINGNIIVNNSGGIYLRDSIKNNITGNEISNNNYGITLTDQQDVSSNNVISRNNFRENGHKNTFSITEQKLQDKNIWDQNYWGRSRLFPKLIFGKKKMEHIYIPWLNVDWHPAQEPYEIEV